MGYKQQVTRPGLDGSAGFLIKRREYAHRTTMPSWEHETQFRIFPAPKEGGGFHPMRESVDDNDFGPAVWAETVVRRLGVMEQFTYPVRIPGLIGDDPTTLLTQALLSLINDKKKELAQRGFADWLDWPTGGKGRSARLTKPQDAIFWQGATIMARGKPFVNKAGQVAPQFPSLLMGTVSLRMGFEQMGNARICDANGNPVYNGPTPESIGGDDDAARASRDAIYAQMFQLGDWCSIEHGRIMRIFQAPATSGGFDKPHYAIVPGDEFSLAGAEDLVRRNWVPWDQLLWYHTAEEQVQMLCRAFPPEAVDYALNGSPYTDLLPQHVKGAWRNQQMPAQQWQGTGQAPQPQQAPQLAAPAPAAPTPAPQPQLPPAPMPAAPAPAPQPAVPTSLVPGSTAAPVSPPTSTAGAPPQGTPMTLNGMDMSGQGEVPDEVDTSLAQAGQFNQVPELQQPATLPQVAPGQLPQPAAANTATPAAAAPTVPNDKLMAAVNQLKQARGQQQGGNPAGQ